MLREMTDGEWDEAADQFYQCRHCDGRGDEIVRGLPGDSWVEACRYCGGTGRAAEDAPPAADAVDPHAG